MLPGGKGFGKLQKNAWTMVSVCKIPCLNACWMPDSAAACKRSCSKSWIRRRTVCAFIIFYIECSEYLGFIITMFIVMFLMLMMLGNKLWVALVSAPLATVAIYLIFAKVLLVPLAEGLFSF